MATAHKLLSAGAAYDEILMELLIAILAGLLAGATLAWLSGSARGRSKLENALRGAEALAAAASAESTALRTELNGRKIDLVEQQARLDQATAERAALAARLEEMGRHFEQQRRMLDDAERKFIDTFKSLASDALKSSNESFLSLAAERLGSLQKQATSELDARRSEIGHIVAPVRDTLASLDSELRRIENERRGDKSTLTEQLRSLGSQTNRLVDALKTPTVRGRWGEIQLRRVVEIAGMVQHCDFDEQAEVATADGRLRPDMTIRLPEGKSIVVDAKAPLQAYMDAIEADGEAERLGRMRNHARQIRNHIEQLSAKSYWDAFDHTPEFVILFLPGEMFFSAALQQDPGLIEDAAGKRVILATPTTLIALLKSVGYGWRQQSLAENAERISELGRTLHERLATLAEHLNKMGGALRTSVDAYNKAVGSLESRVLPAARRFRELGVGGKDEIDELKPVDSLPRELSSAIEGSRGGK